MYSFSMKYAHTKVELRSEIVYIYGSIVHSTAPFNELLVGIAIYAVRSRYILRKSI